jgi:hypothetical protein
MKVVKFKQKDYTVNMEIEEDIAKLEGAKETAFKELVKDAKVPGFRPGKAPRKIYEDYYGTGAIVERATTLLMNEAYRQAIAEKNIFPVDYPKNIDLKEIKEGQPGKGQQVSDREDAMNVGHSVGAIKRITAPGVIDKFKEIPWGEPERHDHRRGQKRNAQRP